MVTGIVVNNTIILVDDILRRRDRNRGRNRSKDLSKVVIISLRKRIIPMLLTSVSTLLGLFDRFSPTYKEEF